LPLYQQLRARPDRTGNPQLLRDHLLNVQRKADTIVKEVAMNSGFQGTQAGLDYSTRSALVRIIAGSHDIGKASQPFQDFINQPNKDTGKRKAHSPLSALYAFFAARKLLSSHSRVDLLSTLAAICVFAHHGKLKSPSGVSIGLHSMKDVLPEQIESIAGERVEELDAICASLGLPPFSEFKGIWRDVLRDFERLQGAAVYNQPDLNLYYTTNDLFSTLIDADRLDAAELEVPHRSSLPFESIVTNMTRIQEEGKSKANANVRRLREAIFGQVKSKAESVKLDQQLYSLTAPTGSGKTLSAFYFALRLRERRLKNRPVSRIVYVAPFLSIIDQNLEVFKRTLDELKKRSDIILEHHHLCEMNYRDEDMEYSTNKSVLLVEGWNSEIVVTTFVQFLYTILGRGSRELRKLHNLSGSIVILDEVQAIPVKYWKLVRLAIRYLSVFYGITFLLMTATQPLIFEKGEIVELIDNYRGYFQEQNSALDISSFNRSDKSRKMTISDFADYVVGILNVEASKRNLMIVLNTIDSATFLYDRLKEGGTNHDLHYLSAEVTPKERLERLELIKRRLDENRRKPNDSKPVLLVTTQLVEAGIDVDFDMVIRDLAPIDSIIQCAGRCNRNGTRPKEKSVTKVVELVDESGTSLARKIYGNVSIQKTTEILSRWDPLGSFSELSDKYYNAMDASRSQVEEEEILNEIGALNYDKLEDFQLFEERPGGSVFIELDDNAMSIFKRYKEIWSQNARRGKAMEEFLKIRSDFYRYVINVPEQYLSHLAEPIFGIYYVGRDNLGKMYNVKGFVRNSSGVI